LLKLRGSFVPTPPLPTRGAVKPVDAAPAPPARPTELADPPPRLAPALVLPADPPLDEPPPDDPLD